MGDVISIPREELRERTKWLISSGWWTALGALAVALAVNALLPGVLSLGRPLGAIAGFVVCNGLIFLWFRNADSRPTSRSRYLTVAHLHLVLDTLFLTVILHYLGGLETPFFLFYVVYVVLASTLFPRGANFAYAGLASFLYLALLLLEATEVIPHHNLSGFRIELRFQQPIHILVNSITLTITAFVSAYFASRIVLELGRREQELLESNLSCEMRGQELVDLNSQLREMDQARAQFTRLVTHELRAPVAAIQSYLKLILEGYVPPEKFTEIIHRAEQRALDQLALIGDLLYMARLEEPRPGTTIESLELSVVLQEVADLVRGQAEEKGLAFQVQVADDLPRVQADLEHMKQLWTNLVSNAIKYTEPGGSVTVTLRSDSDGVVGTVQDTGIGISPADLAHVFDQFYRADNAKAMERHGTGLGLSIARRIVETYGGRIWAESEPGKGSTFSFHLPAEAGTQSLKTTAEPSARPSAQHA